MKRVLSLILVVIISVCVFAACGEEKTERTPRDNQNTNMNNSSKDNTEYNYEDEEMKAEEHLVPTGPSVNVAGIDDNQIVKISAAVKRTAVLTNSGKLYLWGDYVAEHYNPTVILEDVVDMELGENNNAAITSDNSLFIWGYTYDEDAPNGSKYQYTAKPEKILDNVIDVALGDGVTAALTKDGSLYLWGERIGYWDGVITSNPTKVMDNIVDVDVFEKIIVILDSKGDVYTWGTGWAENNDMGTPKLIISGAKSIASGRSVVAVITNENDLYMLGSNEYYQLGGERDTDDPSINEPLRKIMSDVKSVCFSDKCTGVVTTNNELYMWGCNESGEVGVGTEDVVKTPTKIMDDIKYFTMGYYHSAAVDFDNNLYMWGSCASGAMCVDSYIRKSDIPLKVDIFNHE